MLNEAITQDRDYLGRVRLAYVPEASPATQLAAWNFQTPYHQNTTLYSWAKAMQRMMRNLLDNRRYYVGGMYIEFDNSGGAVDPTPVIDRADGLEYYTGLSSPGDYLRVPIAMTSEESTASQFDAAGANAANFYARTAGATGENGLSFIDGTSRVIGGALVAFVDPADASQDILVCRLYLPAASQLVKIANSQIGLLWQFAFL